MPAQTTGESTWTIAKAILPGFTIRRTVREVRLQFTVADDRGRLVNGLAGSDFRIHDNQAAVPRIRNFSRLENLPLQAAILLDVSDSVRPVAARENQAARFFVEHVLRPQTDRASLLAFSNEVRLWQRATGDRNALYQALAKVRQLGFITYLYDSVHRACLEQFSASHEGEFAQRVLVLISDGEDTGSLHSLADAVSLAQRREVQIFALSVHPPQKDAAGDKTLQRLADATGGRFYLAASEKDYPAIFTAMEQEMRNQYSVAFQPAEYTPGFHTVQIELAGGARFQVHARRGYYFDVP